jgi:signal transduction histidine kinase
VSHDLRGPLGGIAGLARVARQRLGEGVVPMVDQALGAIADQADSSSRLVAALLELARVGESEIRRQRLDPAHVAREVIAQIRVATRGALPRIEVHPMPTLDTDPELLRAVLANLIGNAVKFTPAGDAGHVEIGALRTQTSVDLYVRDNGIGFDKQTAATLFQPFRRGHGREFEGHGVGLSIVRRAVERLGGKVSVKSAPGQGARFEFTLPQSASA